MKGGPRPALILIGGVMKEKEQEFKTLQKELGYKFKDVSLLKAALTHSSYSNENKKSGAVNNERLEFLGDSILGMTVATLIYKGKPEMPEGQMTRMRAELVCEKSLAALASTLGLGEHLLLGRGEEKNGGRNRPSMLADTFEAVLAAIYLDGGFKPAESLIIKRLMPQTFVPEFENTDYKTMLQETIQEKHGWSISYRVAGESGPDHMKMFTVEARLNGSPVGRGSGRSKKEAEQDAARLALESITEKEKIIEI